MMLFRRLAAVTTAVMLIAHPALAVDNIFWRGGGGGDYLNAGNWSVFAGYTTPANPPTEPSLPDPAARAVFDLTGNQAVTFSGDATAYELQVLHGNVSFALSDPTPNQIYHYYVNAGDGITVVAPFQSGLNNNSFQPVTASLTMANGFVFTSGVLVGAGDAANHATFTLNGTRLQTTGDIDIAQSGQGTMILTGGALLASSTAVARSLNIGGQSGSDGTLTIQGNSSWTLDDLFHVTLGVNGHGTLNIASGGYLQAGGLSIGTFANNIGNTATVNNGSAHFSGNIDVGSGGIGTLNVLGGGLVAGDSAMSVGAFNNSQGFMTISGTGSRVTARSLNVGAAGSSGSGSVQLTSGAGLTVTNAINIAAGNQLGGDASSSITAGSVQVNGTLSFSGSLTAGSMDVHGGTVTQTGTGAVLSGSLSINNGGTYLGKPRFTSGATATVTDNGSLWNVGDNYAVGKINNPDSLTVSNGGAMSAVNLQVGVTTTGAIALSTGGSLHTVGNVFVGGDNAGPGMRGNVSIDSAASLTADSSLKIWGPGRVTVNGGQVTAGNIVVAGGTFQHVSGSVQSSGNLVVNSGGLYSTPDVVTVGSGGFSSATVTGSNSVLATTQEVHVLSGGNLTMGNGGAVQGGIHLDGGQLTASTTLNVDDNLNLYGHGVIAGNAYIAGQALGTDGTLTVTGNISGHGVLIGDVRYGSLSAPDGDVAISGGPLDIGDASVRVLSQNAMSVQSDFSLHGGTVTSSSGINAASNITGYGHIYANVATSSRLATEDAHALTVHGDVQLGGGSIEADQGSVNVTGNVSGYGVLVGNVTTGSLGPATGNVVLSGQPLNAHDAHVVVLSAAPFSLQTSLAMHGAQFTSASGFSVESNGSVHGDGKFIGDLTNHGFIDAASGASPIGIIEVDGNLTNSADGVIHFDIAGLNTGQLDQIIVKGNAVFAGTLELNFFNGFAPHAGDVLNLFIDDFTGSFSSVNITGLAPGFEYSFTGGPLGFALTAVNDAVSTTVPEPAAGLVFTLGVMCLMHRRRR